MKIWYFCLDPSPSSTNLQYAPSIHIAETIRALQEQGHEVHHFLYGDVPNRGRDAVRQRSQAIMSKYCLLDGLRPFLRDGYELYRNVHDRSLIEQIFETNTIDLVYERLFYNNASVSAYTRRHQIPLIVESNAPAQERRQYWGSPLFFLTKRLEKEILQRADAITVVSTPLKRHYERLGIPAKKVFVLPNGVNENLFSPRNITRDVRAELGLSNQVILGFVGNIHTYHGVELFLPLAREFKSGQYDLHFLVVGAGLGRSELISGLARENLDGLFTFVDPLPNSEIPTYIAAMDICLLPKFMWYGSPMKIFEYGAMGKAIIAPDLENIRDVLANGRTALLFEPDSIPALIKAIRDLLSDIRLLRDLGNAVQKYILANHTWTRNAEKIAEIYNQVTH